MAIRKTLRKRFTSFEVEEQWLNELAQSGWRLIDYGKDDLSEIHYTFEADTTAKKIHYKIDFRPLKNKEEFEDYKTLFHEAGWEIVAKNHRYFKYIFISDKANEIFSDTSSLIEREKHRRKNISFYFCGFGLVALVSLIVLLVKDFEELNVLVIMFSIVAIRYSFEIFKCNRSIRQLKKLG